MVRPLRGVAEVFPVDEAPRVFWREVLHQAAAADPLSKVSQDRAFIPNGLLGPPAPLATLSSSGLVLDILLDCFSDSDGVLASRVGGMVLHPRVVLPTVVELLAPLGLRLGL
jgi:hypothetical protein